MIHFPCVFYQASAMIYTPNNESEFMGELVRNYQHQQK